MLLLRLPTTFEIVIVTGIAKTMLTAILMKLALFRGVSSLVARHTGHHASGGLPIPLSLSKSFSTLLLLPFPWRLLLTSLDISLLLAPVITDDAS